MSRTCQKNFIGSFSSNVLIELKVSKLLIVIKFFVTSIEAVMSLKKVDNNNFIIKTYKFEDDKTQSDQSRIVRIGAVQTCIAAQTSTPASFQREMMHKKIESIIEAAAAGKVNILCLQELWSKISKCNKFTK